MFIVYILLLTRFESTNLMNLNDKWTFGARTLWVNPTRIGIKESESRRRTRRDYTNPPELNIEEFVPNAYFLSMKLGKTFTLGIQGNGDFKYAKETANFGVHTGSATTRDWDGTAGVSLSKYFRAGNLISPFVTLTPNFSLYHESNLYYFTCGVNLDAGVEYFFNVWGKNLSLQVKTPLIKAMRRYSKEKSSSPYDSKNDAYFYSPLQGNLASYLCLHF
jgi:hypothetical protein